MTLSIIINGETVALPATVHTVEQLLEWRRIPKQGTAVAINARVIPAKMHSLTELNNMDNVTIISAAYGG